MDDSARAKEDEAAGLLNRDPVRRWLVGYFRKRRVHAVEDLVQDVQVKLLVGRYCVESNAFAALCVVARSRLIDHIRASARHRAVDVELDVDQVAELQCTSDHTDPSLRLATRRALERMMVERPEKALLLELAAMGHSYKEVASLLLKKPQAEVTELEIGQVRDRIHHARRAARRYLGDEV